MKKARRDGTTWERLRYLQKARGRRNIWTLGTRRGGRRAPPSGVFVCVPVTTFCRGRLFLSIDESTTPRHRPSPLDREISRGTKLFWRARDPISDQLTRVPPCGCRSRPVAPGAPRPHRSPRRFPELAKRRASREHARVRRRRARAARRAGARDPASFAGRSRRPGRWFLGASESSGRFGEMPSNPAQRATRPRARARPRFPRRRTSGARA